MKKIFGLAFAVSGFVAVHLVFAWLVFWLAGIFVSPSVASEARLPAASAAAINLALIALFGLQHSGMSRKAFKAACRRWVAPALERAVYVWAAVLALALLVHLFQPIPATLWRVDGLPGQIVLWALFVLGWSIAAAAYWSAGIFYLLGVSQALAWARRAPQPPPPLVEGYAYRFVRNPQQLGLLIAFWSTPHMTLGQAILAAGLSTFIFIGMALEERDLTEEHGADYLAYSTRTPRILPRVRRRR